MVPCPYTTWYTKAALGTEQLIGKTSVSLQPSGASDGFSRETQGLFPSARDHGSDLR